MLNRTRIFYIILLHQSFSRDKEKIDKIVGSLKLKISARDSKYTDYRIHLHAILRQWLPLSDALLGMVCKVLPSPLDMKEERVKNLMCSGFKKFESFSTETQQLKSGIQLFLSISDLKDSIFSF